MWKQSPTTEGDKRRAEYFYIFISELKIITTPKGFFLGNVQLESNLPIPTCLLIFQILLVFYMYLKRICYQTCGYNF
jgi:hypothetical protein